MLVFKYDGFVLTFLLRWIEGELVGRDDLLLFRFHFGWGELSCGGCEEFHF